MFASERQPMPLDKVNSEKKLEEDPRRDWSISGTLL
jgi:hypothetical protein